MNGALPEDLCTIDGLCVNTIRTLVIDAVQKANSGHPGAPMGLAPAAYILWTRMLKHNPKNPEWFDRDRFVLSGGHASMLLYSLLHLTGYDLSLEDLKNFRQWGSKTPGHPEYGHTPGVGTTTGPLGQGFANAVGMAMAERHLAAIYNRPGHEITDHYTYVMCGDGDMMEGITAEAASLAGHLGLAKLICLYDDNKISIEGSTDLAFTEDVALRFKAYHWNVLRVEDGNDLDAIYTAIKSAQAQFRQPTLILIRTQIAFGSPNKQGSASAHGEPLGKEEVCLTKRNLGCREDAFFCISDQALEVFRKCVDKGKAAEIHWEERFSAYSKAFPDLADKWRDAVEGILPNGWNKGLPDFSTTTAIATREASGMVLNAIAKSVPTLIGGSADLAPSTKTLITGSHDFQRDRYDGRNIRFGVREHAMGGILSGMALHKGLRPYGATFFVFADYIRPAIRLASLMKLPVIYVLTHDSIAVGEDGPTHQPVEHLASLRAIPGLTVIRPADASETAEAWRRALASTDGPVALVLSRQKLPVLDRSQYGPAEGLSKGAYILADPAGKPDIILIGSGSEVHIALQARQQLADKGVSARVVSMPSWELFEKTSQDYRDQVLPPDVTARIAVEAGVPMGWGNYVGDRGAVMGIARFGASAPGEVLMEKFGFTAENLVHKAMAMLMGHKR
jgi:transketolase